MKEETKDTREEMDVERGSLSLPTNSFKRDT